MKFCYVVTTCERYDDKKRAVLETWGKNVNLICLTDDMSQVKGYESCPHKYKHFFTHVDTDADWFIFADDDCYVNTNLIEDFLRTVTHTDACILGALHNTTINSMNFVFPGGGYGFALNKSAMQRIKDYVTSTNAEIVRNSDATLGLWASKTNIKMINVAASDTQVGFVKHYTNKMYVKDGVVNFETTHDALKLFLAHKAVCMHDVTPEMMHNFHNIMEKGVE